MFDYIHYRYIGLKCLITMVIDGSVFLCDVCSVVFQSPDERNYHIFYQLCTAADAAEFIDFHLGMLECIIRILQ